MKRGQERGEEKGRRKDKWGRICQNPAIFLERGKRNVQFQPMYTGVYCSVRPASSTVKAHHMMGKTQPRLCERSFGTNVLVLGQQRDNFLSLSKKFWSRPENSGLELNHVTA